MTPTPPLVLVPGSLNDARVWQRQVDALAGVAPVRVADITGADSTAAMAEAVLAAAPPRFALAGFSLGGYVALEVLRRAPQRLAGLALIATSARPEHPDAVPGRQKMIDLARTDFPRMIAGMRPFMLAAANAGDPGLNAFLDAMMRAVGAAVFVRQSQAVIGRADSRDLLAGIACPALVVCGREDRVTPPKLSEELAQAIPGARLELIDNAGHMVILEAADTVTRLLTDWLAAIAGRPAD
ncbi:MAG: alpha/beta hydrolase [Burkholderiales bacterium]|nr:alpha/beta hydrolase [Burkholderiales bacterium]